MTGLPRFAAFAGILVLLVVQFLGISVSIGPGSPEEVTSQQSKAPGDQGSPQAQVESAVNRTPAIPPAAAPPLTPTPARQVPAPSASPTSTRVMPTPIPRSAPPEPTPTPVVPLEDELAAYVESLDGSHGLGVLDLSTGEQVLIGAEQVFPAASLYKLLVMYRAFQLMESGQLSPGTLMTVTGGDLQEADPGDALSPGDQLTVSRALEAMITFSHNPSAYVLARNVGGWNRVISAAAELGMHNTFFSDGYFYTTPADTLHFFELLATGSLVGPAADEEMISVLLRQERGDRLPADLPPGTLVAHKTGELPGLRHDAGLVFTDDGPYAIVLMSEEIDPGVEIPAQAEISRMVFDRFGP